MTRRLLQCSLALTSLTCGAGEHAALSVGADWPLRTSPGSDVFVVLVVDRSYCYSCAPLSPTLRQIQTDSSGGVRTAILAVDVPTGLMANTVRAERLERVEVIPIGRSAYRRLFGQLPMPALLVISGGVVRWRWHPPANATPGPMLSIETGSQLEEVIRGLLRPSGLK